jgi:hypothetical protein
MATSEGRSRALAPAIAEADALWFAEQGEAGEMRVVEELFEELIARPARAQVSRVLARAAEPVHRKIDQAIGGVARVVGAPVHDRVERLVDDIARRALDTALAALWPGRRRSGRGPHGGNGV